MDGSRFDDIARQLARRAPRRSVLRGFLAAVFGAGLSHPVAHRALATRDSAPTELWYYALGDSIASGHGLDDEDGPEPEFAPAGMASCRDCDAERCQDCAVAICLECPEGGCPSPCDETLGCRPCCRRSSRYAYPVRVRDSLAESYEMVHFTHLACTGASLLPPAPDVNDWRNPMRLLRHQIDAVVADLPLVPGDRPVLISISAGSNDLAFARDVQLLVHLYQDDDATFDAWADRQAEDVRDALSAQLDRLLAFPNVVVVVTDLHNPFNESSIFFTGRNSCLGIPCYDRTDRAIRGLNTQFAAALERSAANQQPVANRRVGLAAFHAAFERHKSPRLTCGDDPPDPGRREPGQLWREEGTWIQYRTDKESNSYAIPRLGQFVLTVRNFLTGSNFTQIERNVARLLIGEWRGDCFHPNRDGASYIAAQVVATALPLLDELTSR